MTGPSQGAVVASSRGVDPRCAPPMLLGPLRARNLTVGDVADKHVAERVFDLTADRRAALPANELLALERMEEQFGIRVTERTRPENLSHHRGILEQRLLVGG